MKKIITIILSIAILFAVAIFSVACGNDSPTNENVVPPVENVVEETPESETEYQFCPDVGLYIYPYARYYVLDRGHILSPIYFFEDMDTLMFPHPGGELEPVSEDHIPDRLFMDLSEAEAFWDNWEPPKVEIPDEFSEQVEEFVALWYILFDEVEETFQDLDLDVDPNCLASNIPIALRMRLWENFIHNRERNEDVERVPGVIYIETEEDEELNARIREIIDTTFSQIEELWAELHDSLSDRQLHEVSNDIGYLIAETGRYYSHVHWEFFIRLRNAFD